MIDPIKDLERLVEANNRIAGIDATKDVDSHWDAYHEQERAYIELDHEKLLAHVKAMEKVCEAAKVLASKAERKKGTTAQWIVWNSELTPLDAALSLLDGKGVK